MTHWNYRLFRNKKKKTLEIREVYYDKTGIIGYTSPININQSLTREDLIYDLETIIKDARRSRILVIKGKRVIEE